MFFLDQLSGSSQTARPSATTLDTAAADIFTGQDTFFPYEVTAFGARVTTATAGAPTTRAKWVIKTLAKNDSTLVNKAFFQFPNAGTTVGDIIFADLQGDGLSFVVEPSMRVRVSVDTASAMPGGSAAGAAIPLIQTKAVSYHPLQQTYSYVTKVTATAT